MSEDFQEFLQVLGQKIDMKGWIKYSGGLSTGGKINNNN